MRLNAKRPSSAHVTKLNVLSFLTPVHMVFSIQTHNPEKAQSKIVFRLNMWKKWVQAKCLKMWLNSKHHFYSVLYKDIYLGILLRSFDTFTIFTVIPVLYNSL